MAFKLSIEQGKGRGQAFDFDAEQITIGRTEENDVVLYEQGVSRRHARIFRQGERYFLEDVESANGTLRNGKKIQREALEDGDTIGIGDVVFRFGSGAKAKNTDGSTRIVAAPVIADVPPTRTRAQPAVPHDLGLVSPAPGQLAINRRYLVIGFALVLCFAVIWAAASGSRHGAAEKQKCPSQVLVLDDVKGDVFSTTTESVCRPGKEISFGFKAQPKTRYLFYYSPFYTEAGAIEVFLNDKLIAKSPLASTRHAPRQEITISENDVKPDLNVITFRPVKGGEWGIERLDLMPIELDRTNAEQGSQHFELGMRLYQQKNVAAANLYNAYVELRTARQFMEGLPNPKPADYVSMKAYLQTIETDMDKVCHDRMWVAHRDQTYRKFELANDQYRYILAAFPGDAHPCRAQAIQTMGPQARALLKPSAAQ